MAALSALQRELHVLVHRVPGKRARCLRLYASGARHRDAVAHWLASRPPQSFRLRADGDGSGVWRALKHAAALDLCAKLPLFARKSRTSVAAVSGSVSNIGVGTTVGTALLFCVCASTPVPQALAASPSLNEPVEAARPAPGSLSLEPRPFDWVSIQRALLSARCARALRESAGADFITATPAFRCAVAVLTRERNRQGLNRHRSKASGAGAPSGGAAPTAVTPTTDGSRGGSSNAGASAGGTPSAGSAAITQTYSFDTAADTWKIQYTSSGSRLLGSERTEVRHLHPARCKSTSPIPLPVNTWLSASAWRSKPISPVGS